jgi:4-hydroxy-2-oxoheptanedioate aldolase
VAYVRTAAMDLARRMRAGEAIATAWSGIPDPRVTAVLARSGYPAITFDMQHGLHDLASVAIGIPTAAAAGAAPIVRLAVDDFAGASRVADMGAVAIIAPMIEDAAGARRLVAHVKYPPLGQRSWGPFEAMGVAGVRDQHEWLATANAATLAFAMIETNAAFAALGEILAVDGLDGVFVGPSDLSIALTGGSLAPSDPATLDTVRAIGAAAVAAGKLAGVYCQNAEEFASMKAAGFRLMALGSDSGLLAAAAATTLAPLGA